MSPFRHAHAPGLTSLSPLPPLSSEAGKGRAYSMLKSGNVHTTTVSFFRHVITRSPSGVNSDCACVARGEFARIHGLMRDGNHHASTSAQI